MTRMQVGRGFSSSRLIIAGITVAAISGWGAFAYSAFSTTQIRQQLNGQVARLQEYQTQLQSQRQEAEEKARQIARLQEQLASAGNEIERLSKKHREAEANLAQAEEKLALVQRRFTPPALENAPALRGVTPNPAKQDVSAAQEALTKLGFGKLEADGELGPTTRKAIEEFQRVAGLTVTGELNSLTLESLMRSARVVAAQNARAE